MKKRVYLDYAASTPVHPQVLEAMLPYFSQVFGNPSSVHSFGQQAEAAIETARETVAGLLNCRPQEVIFTSCGSESDNLALRGAALAFRQTHPGGPPPHLLLSPVEHHAVAHTARQLQELHGCRVEFLPVDAHGRVDPADLKARLRPETALVSVLYANNEIGTLNPLPELGALCRAAGVPFHSDAVQGAAYLPTDVQALQVDLLALGAHKFYGPKGVGALYVRQDTRLAPHLTGGGQEFGLRAGTSNVPYIVGLAEAFRLAQAEREARAARLMPLRDRIIRQVLATVPETRLTGHPSERLPNHTSFVFRGADGNALLAQLDVAGFACSSGSACKTGSPAPSEVLLALGLVPEWALGSLRVTLGSGTTEEDVQAFLATLPGLVERNRALPR
jgi:cysteine desulfurase